MRQGLYSSEQQSSQEMNLTAAIAILENGSTWLAVQWERDIAPQNSFIPLLKMKCRLLQQPG